MTGSENVAGYRRSQRAVWLGSPLGATALIAITLFALYLLTAHTGHVLTLLPFGLFLLCPLLHMFAHGGHGTAARRDGERPHETDVTPPSSHGR